jgi:hypothetical protein
VGFFKQMRAVTKQHADQRKELKAYVKKHSAELVGSLPTQTGMIYLFPDRIIRLRTSEQPESQPIAGVTATMEQIGGVSARTTLTRAATVGDGWQKEVDTRQTFLIVDGPEFQWSLPIPTPPAMAAQQFTATRQFASAVTAAGRAATR